MTLLKHREPATDLPSTPTPPAETSLSSAQKSSTESALSPFATEKRQQLSKDAAEKVAVKKDAVKKTDHPKTTSRLRMLGRAIAHYPNLSQTLFFLMAIGGTSLILLGLLFKDAWSERHNNPAIISAILKMELAREDFRVIESTPERVITHSFNTLEPYVEAEGWQWINRFGTTITYGKQDQRMIASCSPYSPLYIICDLGEIPK